MKKEIRKYTKRIKLETPSEAVQSTPAPMKLKTKYNTYNDIPEDIRLDIEGVNKWLISCGVKDNLEDRKERALIWWRKCG